MASFRLSALLSEVKKFYQNCGSATRLRGLYFIHDNAAACRCVQVQDFLEKEKVVQLPHPP